MRNIGSYETVCFFECDKDNAKQYQVLRPACFNPIEEKIKFLDQVKRMSCNWDGYGAKVPSSKTVDNAIWFLEMLPPNLQKTLSTDELSVTPYGTVVMDWSKDDKHFISVEIGASKIGFFSETKDKSNPSRERIDLYPDNIENEILPVFTKVF